MQTKIKYEDLEKNSPTLEYLNARNKEMYRERLRTLSDNKYSFYNDEKEFYLSQLKSFSRPEAIRAFCSCCMGEKFKKSDKVECELTWGQEYNNQNPEGCPLSMWRAKGMMKYQPKKTTKMTQKKAIAYICKQCQEVKQLDKNVQHCTAFWGEHKQCPLHPFRMGKNYWSTREVSEETIRKMREARNQNSR
jgi:hypothetical protein